MMKSIKLAYFIITKFSLSYSLKASWTPLTDATGNSFSKQ